MATPREPSGRYIPLPKGGQAFVPAPLPPILAWSPDLVAAISEASLYLGRLSGQGAGMPNPHLLIRPFIRREAVLSSRIEGTQATLGEILAEEAGAAVERAPEDIREVRNYVIALEAGVAKLAKASLSLTLVKELHLTLMKGVRGDSASPGKFRENQNWIGAPGSTPETARFVPPPPGRLPALLEDWERYMRERNHPALAQAALLHYQFEAIHPFRDGNGRVGRLLIPLFLIERGLLPSPLLYLSAFFEANRRDYYDLLTAVSTHGEWEPWMLYFMHGVAQQSKDALGRVEKVNSLLDTWRRRLASRQTKTVMALVDRITGNPFVTVSGFATERKIAFTTAQRAIDALVGHKILQQTDDSRRGRVYVAKPLLLILDEPVATGRTP